MKKIITLTMVILLFVVTSCVKNPNDCLERVKSSFPNCDIYKDLNNGEIFKFYVFDTIGKRAFIVECNYQTSPEISHVTTLMEQK